MAQELLVVNKTNVFKDLFPKLFFVGHEPKKYFYDCGRGGGRFPLFDMLGFKICIHLFIITQFIWKTLKINMTPSIEWRISISWTMEYIITFILVEIAIDT